MSTTQITPVTELQKNYGKVLKQLEVGPVFLAQRSKPVGVILSPEAYDKLNTELKRLQRIIAYDRQFSEIRAGNYTELPAPETV
jgi:prevent-host-death family protein